MIKSSLPLLVFAAMGLFAKESGASAPTNVVWSVNASSCVPAETAIQGNLYLTTAGSVKHASTKTANITLYCPIGDGNSGFTLGPNKLFVTYRDSDGTSGTAIYVDAGLTYLDMTAAGALTTIATFESSSTSSLYCTGCTTGDSGNVTNYVGFTHTFDFTKYAYYIRLDLARSMTTDTAIVYTVSIGS